MSYVAAAIIGAVWAALKTYATVKTLPYSWPVTIAVAFVVLAGGAGAIAAFWSVRQSLNAERRRKEEMNPWRDPSELGQIMRQWLGGLHYVTQVGKDDNAEFNFRVKGPWHDPVWVVISQPKGQSIVRVEAERVIEMPDERTAHLFNNRFAIEMALLGTEYTTALVAKDNRLGIDVAVKHTMLDADVQSIKQPLGAISLVVRAISLAINMAEYMSAKLPPDEPPSIAIPSAT